MNIKLNSEDLNSIYYKMTMISEKRLQQVYTLPLQNGSGTVERIPLRNGIELLWFDVTPEESFSLNCHVHYPHLEIFYSLSGSGFWENERNSYEMSTNTSNLLFVQNQKVYAEFSAKEKIIQMELRFDLRLLEHLYVEKKQLFNKQFFCKQITGCPRIRVMMEQMKNCPYTGALKKLYLEGIALELLALHLHRVEQEEIMKRAAVRLSLTDIEALQQAKEVLDHSFLSPLVY
ncbi:hypothetical protein ACFSKI_14690 [Pseudogracilibacillus auburnensis]|uniref:AraC family transcriptional regulator n=1 Tax=Pseudogracilibacillus auburnensis TaxID=1494959 RepID=A0A2V3VPM2_9BACI|nr:hypothetical protein [Pseudogracilibacillus auburnensis]PXW83823.1 hypothetical protein DFR56_114108 [Pseudogracilibacillus auburnensis]